MLKILIHPKKTVIQWSQTQDELLCLPAIGVALTTIIQMIGLVCAPAWGYRWGHLAYILWWISVVENLVFSIIAISFPALFQTARIQNVDATILLAAVSPLTTAAAGGVLSTYAGLSPAQNVPMIIVSYMLLGMGLWVAMVGTVFVYIRLATHGLPLKAKTPGTFILMGPWGQGSFALLVLGGSVRSNFPAYGEGTFLTADLARAIEGASLLTGLILYGISFFSFIFVFSILLRNLLTDKSAGEGPGAKRWRIPFGLPWWSFIFPMGVFCASTEQLANSVLSSGPLEVWAAILIILMVIIWLATATLSILAAGRKLLAKSQNKDRASDVESGHDD